MSAIYPLARENLLDWALNNSGPASVGLLYMIGVTSGYAFNAAHADLADVPGGDICIAEVELANSTIAAGVIDGDDIALTGLTPGPTLDALIIYARWPTGESQLIFYIDSDSDASLPLELTTSKLTINWPLAGIGKI